MPKTLKKGSRTPLPLEEVKRLYEEGGKDGKGLSVRGIAEHFGCSYGKAHTSIGESGAKFRKRGGSMTAGKSKKKAKARA
ncbi:helix-turn-helix domain-containing protein [Kitasatospora sp. NPDC001309]|uniref:helix-turn-helix domain-containing protein n=1 Tax=Kitasatospora sp. NPDC001309 TaxID=3364013 RepID=UPI0036A7FAEC